MAQACNHWHLRWLQACCLWLPSHHSEAGQAGRFCCTGLLLAFGADLQQGHTVGGSWRHDAPSGRGDANVQRGRGNPLLCHSG